MKEKGAGSSFFIFPARCTLLPIFNLLLPVACCLLIAFAPSLFAMPLNPDAYKKLKGSAKLSAIENVFQSSPTLNKPSAQKFATITGTRKVLVLLVDFSDNTGTTASSIFDEKLFSVGTTATGSMRDYYNEVSYGKFDISGTVTVKYYRAPQIYNYYVNYQGGISEDSYPNNAQKLAEDVVNLANADIDFSQYDSNGDGYVDGLFIIHAGGGAEEDGNMGKIWSHKWTTAAPVTVDGVKVSDYTMEPEDGNIGVFCHEYGHELGLPDLYDTTPAPTADSYGLGWWSLMAIGGWLNDGKTPSHLDAWSKSQLGWAAPTTITANQLSASIPQVETNATIYKLWTSGAPVKEYFLVENRQQTKFDAYLPGGGLLIYHVDDNVTTNNDNSSHYLVALMQADGLKNLEGYANKGDAGDYFPGSTTNNNFNGATTPDSKNYASTETFVAVNNISSSGATMTADLYVSSADVSAPTCTVASLAAYTNTASFTVTWSGTDTGNPASGVKNYDVQYRVGANGTWTDWFTGTTATQAVYTGSDGQTIYFQCRAIDNSSNQGSYSSAASTMVDLTAPTASITPLSATQVTAAFTVSWSGSDSLSGVKSYDVEYMDAADGVWKNNWVQAGTTLTTATFAGIDGHTYYFRIRATDNAGNTGNFTSAPTCSVSTLAAYTTTASFTVAWSDADAGDGSVKNYDVQYRAGASGAWTDWLTGTTSVQSVYTANEEKTIYFRCRATESVNTKSAYSETIGVAQTSYDATPPTASITPLAATQVKAAFTVSWSGSDSLSGVKSYDVEYMDASDGVWKNDWVLPGTLATTTSATFNGKDGHTYYFRVLATDNAGNTGSFTSAATGDTQTIVAVDYIPPVISNVTVSVVEPSAEVPEDTPEVTIQWSTDEATTSEVKYGTTPDLGLSMPVDTLATTHEIDLGNVLQPATTYYIQVETTDVAGNVTTSDIQSFRTPYTSTVTVPKGLSMISFPLTPTDKNAGNIFSDANLKFARYDASVTPPKYHYYKDDPNDSYLEVAPGRGYWIKLDAEKTITVTGSDVTDSTYSVSLNAGWNQIGNPYTAGVSIDALKVTYQNETVSLEDASKKGWVANYLWSYESESMGYRLITPPGMLTVIIELEPGKGYWIYAVVPCSLVFTNPSTTTAKTIAKQDAVPQNSSNLIQFTLSSSSGSDTENYAGFANDNVKISDPPPALESTGKPELYLKSASTGETNYALVAKKKNYGEEVFYLSVMGNDGEQATLSWNFNASEFASAGLVDETGKEVSLMNEKQITLTKEPKQFIVKLKLKAPSVEANTENGGKLKIMSAINFPNPDRVGNATFRYDVQGDVIRVLIEVYTLTGKKITSIEGNLSGETKWLFGDTLPSGVYIYRITAFSPDGKDSVVRKMVILK